MKSIEILTPVPISDLLLTIIFAMLLFISWTYFSKFFLLIGLPKFIKLNTIYLIILCIVLVFFYHAAVNGKLLNKITSKPDENVIDTSDKIESPKLNTGPGDEPKTVNQNPISDKDLVNLDQEIKKRGTFKYDLTGNVKPYDIHT